MRRRATTVSHRAAGQGLHSLHCPDLLSFCAILRIVVVRDEPALGVDGQLRSGGGLLGRACVGCLHTAPATLQGHVSMTCLCG